MQRVSFYFLYAFLWVFTLLPLRVLYYFSDLLYILVYRMVGYRKEVVFNNLRTAFPEKSEQEIETIASKFYHHFCDHIVETFKAMNISKKEHLRRYKFTNPELLEQYYNKGKSVIGVFGHYSNWEWMQVSSFYVKHKFVAIYKPQSNKQFDWLSNKLRSQYGNEMIAMKDTLRRFIEFNKEGTLIFSLFLGDQSPIRTKIQHWTTFFGQETPVLIGTEKISKKLDHAVVYIDIRKVKRGYYEVDFIDLEGEPKKTGEYEITNKYFRILEEKIRRNPELWLWSHRRWKHKREVIEAQKAKERQAKAND